MFVRFPSWSRRSRDLIDASLVVWTTTPWTLPSNTGAAVAGERRRTRSRARRRTAHRGRARSRHVLGDGWTEGDSFDGAHARRGRYEPPYPNVEGAHTVVAADFVSMEDGTGIVHLAPAFGPDDLAVGRAQGWPVWRPVADDGTFTDDAPAFVRGLFVKDADPAIVDDLRTRGS